MLTDDKLVQLKSLQVKAGKSIQLKDYSTPLRRKTLNNRILSNLLETGRKKLAQMQDKLYAHNQYSVLIVFQAMDAAGKDGAVKHIMSGLTRWVSKYIASKLPLTRNGP